MKEERQWLDSEVREVKEEHMAVLEGEVMWDDLKEQGCGFKGRKQNVKVELGEVETIQAAERWSSLFNADHNPYPMDR